MYMYVWDFQMLIGVATWMTRNQLLDTYMHFKLVEQQKYSTNEMQGISLTHLSLVTNAFIADNQRVYHWRKTCLVMEKYTFSDVYECV